jgi:hypothetical protein
MTASSGSLRQHMPTHDLPADDMNKAIPYPFDPMPDAVRKGINGPFNLGTGF